VDNLSSFLFVVQASFSTSNLPKMVIFSQKAIFTRAFVFGFVYPHQGNVNGLTGINVKLFLGSCSFFVEKIGLVSSILK
jgi:hypothetical protein